MMGDGEVVVWRVGVAKTEVVASACVVGEGEEWQKIILKHLFSINIILLYFKKVIY